MSTIESDLKTTPDPMTPHRNPLGAAIAFWIRQGQNELDNGHQLGSYDDQTHDPGDAVFKALDLNDFEDAVLPLSVILGISTQLVVATASVIRTDPYGDHTQAMANIVRTARTRVDAERNAALKERSGNGWSGPCPLCRRGDSH